MNTTSRQAATVNRPVIFFCITLCLVMLITQSLFAETLKTAVEKTIQSNPEIQAAIQARNASEQNLSLSRSEYYPEIHVAAGIGDENTDSPFTRSLPGSPDSIDLTRKETALVIRQLLYDGFASTQTVESSEARLSAANMRLRATVETTALKTAEVYMAVMREQKLLELASENLEIHKQIYERIRQRSESGIGRKADLDQAEGRLALAQSQLIASEANYYNARISYRRVVGEIPQTDMVMPESFADSLPVNIEEAANIAVRNNPTLNAARSNVLAASAQQRVARSGFHPQLDLVYEQTWDDNLDGVEGENEGYSMMLQFKYNLFNGGGDNARSRQAAFLVEESRAVQDRTQREIIEDLNTAWTTYKAVRNQLIYLKRHADASKQTQDAYDKQFNLGRRTLLDLLDARNELFEANREYYRAQFDAIYRQYRVLSVMGQLAERFLEQ